jgi:hypothetical protein
MRNDYIRLYKSENILLQAGSIAILVYRLTFCRLIDSVISKRFLVNASDHVHHYVSDYDGQWNNFERRFKVEIFTLEWLKDYWQILKLDKPRTLLECLLVFEYLWVKKNLDNISCDELLYNGLQDRMSFYLSHYCSVRKIEYGIYQHGSLSMLITDFPRVRVHSFYYYIPESVNYISQVAVVEKAKIFIKRKSDLLSCSAFSNTIAVCTQPWNEKLNRSMITTALEISERVILYRHPRDAFSYQDLGVKEEEFRYLDHKVIIMRYSSLYVEYRLAKRNVLIYDVDDIDSDILRETGRENCFTDIAQLKEVATRYYNE